MQGAAPLTRTGAGAGASATVTMASLHWQVRLLSAQPEVLHAIVRVPPYAPCCELLAWPAQAASTPGRAYVVLPRPCPSGTACLPVPGFKSHCIAKVGFGRKPGPISQSRLSAQPHFGDVPVALRHGLITLRLFQFMTRGARPASGWSQSP